ncbi:glycerophosphodiester phosphodiesterase family protein [Gemmatimonas sp.]|jgi:glycerophosphoryl diester phosphodiesterase|uniref:glycerophosphodiester phosphodiesterase family protein n=1 Tax=Gemmatimonas sp. TaxID=1962908 RepID=UPI0037BE2D03
MILLDPNARPVIGHRGNRAHAPENTLPSLLEAVALGADAVEFDVRITRDGVLVLMHDVTLDRTTDASGAVAAYTFADLVGVDAGARFTSNGRDFPWRGRGAGVPRFDHVIEALPRDLPLIVEVKTPDATPALVQAIARHNLTARVIVAGFDPASTFPLRHGAVALGASTPDVARLVAPAILRQRVPQPWYRALCIPPTRRGIPVPIGSIVRAVREHGVVTHVWTVNEPSRAQRLWRQGVQGIISDDPALMLAARRGV